MSLDNFQVFTKTYAYMNWLFPITMAFPKDQHWLSLQRYETSSKQLAEIGRLLGGWLRQARAETPGAAEE